MPNEPRRGRARAGLQERVERRFFGKPPTPIAAAGVIAGISLAVSLVGGIVVYRLDDTFDSLWLGVYWAVQTVTTVGYGDITPQGTDGQAIAVALMLLGTAFIAVVTAAVTTVFVEQARALREREEDAREDDDRAVLDEILARVERIEAGLGGRPAG